MKKSICSAIFALTCSLGFAQTLQQAITKTENERYADAASDFLVLVSKEPTKGENYFYLGENYFKDGISDKNEVLIDSANIFYAKGVEVNATNPLNYVGLGKVLLAKNNVNDAKTQFFKAASVAQNKNAEVMRRTAEAWLSSDNKNPDEAIAQINAAIKLDPKNAENYVLLGDAQLEKNPTDGSGPVKSYQMATTLNPKSPRGILSEGKLYRRGRNYNLALEKYKAALAIDPTFAPAYRELAELYYLAGQNARSIENWKKYLELNNSDQARYRFMNALFKNKQYPEVITEFENLMKSNFKSYILKRLAAYSYYELGEKGDKEAYKKGLDAMNDFFNSAGPNFKYLGTDFKYKGLLMMKTGQDSLGIVEMEKGIKMDTSLTRGIYSEIGNTYYKNKRYDKSILYFEKKMAYNPMSLNNNDWYNYGKSQYYMGIAAKTEAGSIKDPKKKALKEADALPYFVKADTAFSNLARLNPTWPIAYTWRGRANYELDTKAEKDLTKMHFEKVISTVKPEEKTTTYKANIIEALEYLGYYYVTKKDKTNADATFKLLLETDPANEKATKYFAPPKPGGTKPR